MDRSQQEVNTHPEDDQQDEDHDYEYGDDAAGDDE